jgi:hypothetical protein
LAVASKEEDAVVDEFDIENLVGPMADVDDISEATYWLTPVKSDEKGTAEDVVLELVKQHNMYAFGERTPGRRHIQPRDYICFYANGNGVIGHARVVSYPKKEPHPKVHHPDRYPWTLNLDSVRTYLDNPVVIDSDMRSRLDAFDGRDPNTSTWGWFVQATRKLTAHDFALLTRQAKTE